MGEEALGEDPRGSPSGHPPSQQLQTGVPDRPLQATARGSLRSRPGALFTVVRNVARGALRTAIRGCLRCQLALLFRKFSGSQLGAVPTPRGYLQSPGRLLAVRAGRGAVQPGAARAATDCPPVCSAVPAAASSGLDVSVSSLGDPGGLVLSPSGLSSQMRPSKPRCVQHSGDGGFWAEQNR